MIDPVFGEIEYFPRIGGWCAGHLSLKGKLSSLKGKLSEVDEISLIADESGPSAAHRETFEQMLIEYERWIRDVEEFLYNDYLKWCQILEEECGWGDLTKVRGFPVIETSQDALEHASFRSIEVSEANVYIYIGIGWEEEHNRGVFIENGRYIGYDVS